MDPIEQVFESIDKLAIQRFVHEGRQEDLHLEFKTMRSEGTEGSGDRKNFAKAVSGFANSSGGIVVWGIMAKKNSDGVDAAADVVPISNVAVKYSRLQEQTGQATVPIVSGVRHKLIYEDESRDTGFIVTVVPESERGPHMALLGEHEYFKRSGSSFYPMEHFDIADMFGRRQRPDLSLGIGLNCLSTSGPVFERVYHTSIVLNIRNSGRGIAKYPRMDFRVFPPYLAKHDPVARREDQNYKKVRRLSINDHLYSHAFFGNADDVIHPNSTLEVAMLDKIDIDERSHFPKELKINVRLWAEGAIEITQALTWSGDEILELLKQTRPYKERDSR